MTTWSTRAAPVRERPGRPLAAFFVPSLAMGGGERISIALARELVDQGIDVDLVVGDARGPLRAEVPPEVTLVDLGAPRLRAAGPALVRYLRRRRPQTLVPTVEHASLLALVAGRLTGIPVVVRVANTLSVLDARAASRKDRLVLALARRGYRRADALVACSQGMADDLADYCGLPREQIRVIPNPTVGREVEARAAEALDHPWFRPGEPPVVLGVGRLSPQKNFPLLLEAFARLETPARLVVLGEGPERPALEAQVRALGLADRVELAGIDPNPYRYLARAAVFVLSSSWEGLPGVLIEAIACGCDVVATDCPSGPREILRGGELGRLVPVDDPAALAAALDERLRAAEGIDPGEAARYHADVVATRYLAVLQGVAG
jgi:glycosyltransferase involved in cell wall biosynthesis